MNKISKMKEFFKTCQLNTEKSVVVIDDGKRLYLDNMTYIVSNNWFWSLTDDKTDRLDVSDVIRFVENEARSDKCWSDDIYVAPIDACIKGDIYFVTKGFVYEPEEYKEIKEITFDEEGMKIILK